MEEIKSLKKLGLTEYEARAYFSLAKLGPSTVKEIVVDSKLPRNKAYEALQKLEEKNKVLSLPFSPKKYKISDPSSFKEELKEMDEALKSIITLAENPKKTEFKEFFWVLKGKKAIEDKLRDNNEKVEKEILSCNRLSKIIYENVRMLEKSIKRGVKVKMICDFDKKNVESYKAWLSTGAEIRVFNKKMFGNNLPRISIFDGKIARLTIGKPEVSKEEDYMTLWTESRVFAQMLRSHFLNMWKHSLPISKFLKNN